MTNLISAAKARRQLPVAVGIGDAIADTCIRCDTARLTTPSIPGADQFPVAYSR